MFILVIIIIKEIEGILFSVKFRWGKDKIGFNIINVICYLLELKFVLRFYIYF